MARNVIKKLLGLSNKGILTKDELNKLIQKKEITIVPLLEQSQIGEISIDLRIGTDFLALHQGREAFIDTTKDEIQTRPIKSHFTETRRRIGEHFLLHPSQPVLFSTLEYIKLPNNVYVVLSLRSSYSRLGLTISTIVQPGYCGCFSIEIVNSGNTPIKLVSGARFIQARFIRIENPSNYFQSERKYTCQVRPMPSKANEDIELNKLNNLYKTK
jgi:dCTP deaminase